MTFGALLRILITFICVQHIEFITACILDTDCDSTQLCSPFDLICYSIFNISDYAEVNISQGSAIDGPYTPVSLITDNILDNDESTLITLNGGTKWYKLDFILNGNYWVHDILLKISTVPIMNFYIDGVQYTISTDDESYGKIVTLDSTIYPMRVTNITMEMMQYASGTYNVIDFIIAGAYDTPSPTLSPTDPPTDDTFAPTFSPSNAPSTSPSAAPTSYPTPDVCEEYLVTQSCCGHYGFQIEDDKVNIRDASLTSCTQTFITECCGTLGGFDMAASSYGCGGQYLSKTEYTPTEAFCDVSYYNVSLNNTDEIMGTVINGENILWDETGIDPNNISAFCRCEWTTYECEGMDLAMCGTQQSFDDMFDLECWGNETLWTAYDDFTNETCWKDAVVDDESLAHLLWEPCSEESFIGSVTSIDDIPSELVHEDDCSCTYSIRDCQVLEDQSKTQCGYAVDCANDGECNQELAAPCCAYSSYADGEYSGVTPQLDGDNYPTDTWYCNNDVDTLCPDIFNGTRVFTVETRVDWWFDGNNETITERCGCLYVTDECNLPTESPTMEPTSVPTDQPTKTPTDDSFASMMSVSFFVVLYPLLYLLF